MAKRITEEDIININNLYLKYGTYSGVAAELGFAASTVKKYIIPEYKPQSQIDMQKFSESDIPEFDPQSLEDVEDFGDICTLTNDEVIELKNLWKEMII